MVGKDATVLTPFDDYPIHQSPLPLAMVAGGHPDAYDRFWFNGYRGDLYFGVAMALYPNRGIIDAAMSVVRGGIQRSVFASGRIPADRTQTRIGPIRIELAEPLRINRVLVDAADLGLEADLTYTARTPAIEEPRQTRYAGSRLMMDVTRLTQWGRWSGRIAVPGEELSLAADGPVTYGTKDRSWGVRPVGAPAPSAPALTLPQLFFLWAPLNFDDCAVHFMVFEDEQGEPWARTAAVLPEIGPEDPVWGEDLGVESIPRAEHHVRWAPGLRRSEGAEIVLHRRTGAETIELEPLLTFRMRGLGYSHPTWGHGHWHGELATFAEEHAVGELDSVEPSSIHVQQVMRARWGDRTGLGVLEQAAFGPHAPSGLKGLFDGFGA